MFLDWDWPVVWSLPGPVSHDDVPPLSLVQSKMSSVSCVQVHKSFSKLHLSLYLAQVAGSSSLSSPQSSEKSQTLKFHFGLSKAACLSSILTSFIICVQLYAQNCVVFVVYHGNQMQPSLGKQLLVLVIMWTTPQKKIAKIDTNSGQMGQIWSKRSETCLPDYE